MSKSILHFIWIILITFLYSEALLAQSWDFEDDIGDFAINNGTAEVSTDFALSGTQSIKISGIDGQTGADFENTSYTNVNPGDTLYFHVYATSIKDINGFQVFVKNGPSYSFISQYTNATDIDLNTWNKLSFVIPDTATSINTIGFQLNNTSAGTPSIYVDDIAVTEPVIVDYSPIVFDFADGVGDFTIANGTAEPSSDFTLSGIQSIKITGAAGQTGTDFENLSFTNINPGDTLSFNVYTNNIADINGFQVYIKEGAEYSFISNYTNAGDITLSAWNKLSLVIPDTATDVKGFGFQLNNASAATPSVYVDDATISPFDPSSVVPKEPVLETWDFEVDVATWSAANNTGIIETSDEASYSGFQSLKVTALADTDRVEIANYSPSDYAPDQVLSYRVWVPETTTDINGISPFIQTNGYSVYTSEFYLVGDLVAGSWNEVTVQVPDYDEMNAIGLQLLGNNGASNLPAIYVDLISTDSENNGIPTLTTPANVTQDSLGKTYAAFSWDASTGNGLPQYVIYRNEAIIDTVTNTNYLDASLTSETYYNYNITSLDPFGRESEPTVALSVTTEAFDSQVTWDFESGLDGWTGNTATAEQVDSVAYSGQHSVKVVGGGSSIENYFQTNTGVTDIIAGQTLTYQVWIPEASIGVLDGIQVFLKHGAGFSWMATWHSAADFETNTWNEVSVKVPPDIPGDSLKEVGLQIYKNDAAATPTIFIDYVTTDPTTEGTPIISAPANLTTGSPTKTGVSLTWDASVGLGGGITYNVYSSTSAGLELSAMSHVGTASTNSFDVTGLSSGVDYYFKVTGIDATGKETAASNEVSITTDDFDTHATYDFESGLQGWTTSGASAELTNSISYSGVNSVMLTSSATEGFFELIDSDTEAPGTPNINNKIQLGHTLTYRVWIPEEEIPNIDIFQIWYKDGSWGWSSSVVNSEDIEGNTWNEFSVTIDPSTANINSVGFQIIKTAEGDFPTVFIDLISTEQNPIVRPHLSVPQIVSDSFDPNDYTITWASSSGDDVLKEYNVYVNFLGNEETGFEKAGSTTDTTYTIPLNSAGGYLFQVTAVDENDRETTPSETREFGYVLPSIEGQLEKPKEFALANNYPNPFNPTTQIQYDIPEISNVKLQVYDITGRLIQTLVNERKNAGRYTVNFRAGNLASGMYFYRIEAGSFSKVQQMMLIK